MKKTILCDHCRGSGAASDRDIHTCRGCGGSGVKVSKQQIFPGMFAQTQTTCNDCGGRGSVIVKKCPHCGGQKVMEYMQPFTLEIQPGMPEGHEVVLEGEGDESPDWEAGDIILRVRSKREQGGWRRKETSLYWRETIGVDEVCPSRITRWSCTQRTIGIIGLQAQSHSPRRTGYRVKSHWCHSAWWVLIFAS